jgi:hypothetical protein
MSRILDTGSSKTYKVSRVTDLTGTNLGDVGSSLSQFICPPRERVASLSLADYQTANLLSNSSKSFGLISSELLPLTVQSTPSLS